MIEAFKIGPKTSSVACKRNRDSVTKTPLLIERPRLEPKKGRVKSEPLIFTSMDSASGVKISWGNDAPDKCSTETGRTHNCFHHAHTARGLANGNSSQAKMGLKKRNSSLTPRTTSRNGVYLS